jgi:hypothetical protein
VTSAIAQVSPERSLWSLAEGTLSGPSGEALQWKRTVYLSTTSSPNGPRNPHAEHTVPDFSLIGNDSLLPLDHLLNSLSLSLSLSLLASRK